MNGKERMLAALRLEQPDIVPLWEQAFNESSIIGIAKHFMDADKLPESKPVMSMTGAERLSLISGLLTFAKELDMDGVTATSLAPREDLGNDMIRDSLGIVYRHSEHGEPYPVDGPIKEPSDFVKYKMRKPAESDFLLATVLRSNLPDKAVAYHMPATFKLSWGLRGSMENLLMDYIVNPQLARDLARMVTDYCFEIIEGAHKRGADFIIVEGDLAFNPGPLMRPSHYDEFIGPYHKELVDCAHGLGLAIVKHSDGNLEPLFPALIAAGFDGIHPIQPQCMNIGEIKNKYGRKVCLLGNIDCSFLLVFGSPEEVDQNVKETIAVAAPGGGYIISSSNSIHPGCKPENYIALARAARKYGRYPIDVNQ